MVNIDIKALHQRAMDRMFRDPSVIDMKDLVGGTTNAGVRTAANDAASHALFGFSMPKGMTKGKVALITAGVGLTAAGMYALLHKPKEKGVWVSKEDARRAPATQQGMSV